MGGRRFYPIMYRRNTGRRTIVGDVNNVGKNTLNRRTSRSARSVQPIAPGKFVRLCLREPPARRRSTQSRPSALTPNTGCSGISKRLSSPIATFTSCRTGRSACRIRLTLISPIPRPCNERRANQQLARSFDRAASVASMRAALAPPAAAPSRARLAPAPLIPMLAPPLPAFITAAQGRRICAVSVGCVGVRTRFSRRAARVLQRRMRGRISPAMGKRRLGVEAAAPAPRERQPAAAVIRQGTIQALPKADRKR